MKRVEVIEQVHKRLLGSHEERFGWTGVRDGRTGYYYKFKPGKYDYSLWKRKAEALEGVMDFLAEVQRALDELAEIGAEDAVSVTASVRYDACIKAHDGVLVIGYGYTYLSTMINDLRPPVEAEGELTMEEYINKAKEKIKGYGSSRETLEFFKQAFYTEYLRAKAHLEWLEEEVGLEV